MSKALLEEIDRALAAHEGGTLIGVDAESEEQLPALLRAVRDMLTPLKIEWRALLGGPSVGGAARDAMAHEIVSGRARGRYAIFVLAGDALVWCSQHGDDAEDTMEILDCKVLRRAWVKRRPRPFEETA